MIISGFTARVTVEMIQAELAALPFDFHATGSRVFGAVKSNSDWDYFAANDPDCEEQLLKIGFKEIELNDYKHQGLRKLFHHSVGIHIQLVDDTNIKQKAQEIMLIFCRGKGLSKGQLAYYWQAVFDCLMKKS